MLLTSLLTAIVRTDGDALVMHVGDRPYVVTSGGHVDLSTSGLALDAMEGMLSQLLPEDQLRALEEFGAVEQRVTPPEGFHDGFKIVAARGGDDIWIEIMRQRFLDKLPQETPQIPAAQEPEPAVVAEAPSTPEAPVAAEVSQVPEVPQVTEVPEMPHVPDVLNVPEMAQEPEVAMVPQAPEVSEVPEVTEAPELPEVPRVPELPEEQQVAASEPVVAEDELYELMAPAQQHAPQEMSEAIPELETDAVASPQHAPDVPDALEAPPAPTAPAVPSSPGVVLPMTRTVRIEVPSRGGSERRVSVERLLNFATTRGASALYLTSQSRPFIRVEGEIRAVDSESTLSPADVEAALVDLMPESARDAYGSGQPAEWVSEFDNIGRIHCTTFTDYRGPGAIFHLISARPMSADQLGLPREIQALAADSEGLVVVASPRGGGKSTLVAALVDSINRNDGGYIISLERQIRVVHENRHSLVSQREVRGTAADALGIARAALRENPDVLVIEDLNSPEMIQLALDAAGSGLLVFLSITAGSTVSALTRIVDLFPPERRKALQAVLAEHLCGAVGQVLVRKVGGGHLAAHELLLSTEAVSRLIADGQLSQLPLVVDSSRKLGMFSLNDTLLGYVRSGLVEVREAYRKAYDRDGLLVLLKRDGRDTSLADRFG